MDNTEHNNKLHITDKLLPSEIKKQLKTYIFGKDIIYLEKTDSTNRVARDLANRGASEGTLVIAEEQTKGRGRLERSWISGS